MDANIFNQYIHLWFVVRYIIFFLFILFILSSYLPFGIQRMVPNEGRPICNLAAGSVINHPTVTKTNTSTDHLDVEYTTCISSESSPHELGMKKQILANNHDRPRTLAMTMKHVPNVYFRHVTTSYKNIKYAPGILKPTALSTKFSSTPHLSKLRKPRDESILKIHNYQKLGRGRHTIFNRSAKLFQQNAFRVGVSSGAKVIHKHGHTKLLGDGNKKIPINEQRLRSNDLGIPMINVNMPPEKIDVYYFDHGTSGYYLTTDIAPILLSDKCVDKLDNVATRFWAEIFGTFHIGMTFVTAFILQFLRFIFRSIVRPLIIGMIQMGADYAFKPFLTIIFNAIIQPILIFLLNITTSFRDVCEPIAKAMGYFFREFANFFRAIRLIEINLQSATNSNHHHRMNEPT